MVKACCVKNCHTNGRNTKGKVSLHLLPSVNPELMVKWIDFLGYGKDWKPPKYAAICSLHFQETDFSKNTNIRRLLTTAIPTIKTEGNKISRKLKNRKIKLKPSRAHDVQAADASPKVNKTCRLCGLEYKTDMKNIFDHDNSYAERINKFLRLSISQNDTLPHTLCDECENKFDEFEKFIGNVYEVQITLAQKFASDLVCDKIAHQTPGVIECETTEKPDFDCHMPDANINSNEVKPFVDNQIFIYPGGLDNRDNLVTFDFKELMQKNSNQVHFGNVIENGNQPFLNNASALPGSDYNSNSFVMIPNEHCNVPIKMETVPPATHYSQLPMIIKPLVPNNNKKIEILQDIKLDPNKLTFKPFKSVYNEFLPNVNNLSQKTINKKIEVTKKQPTAKLNKVNTLLSKSTNVCKHCGEKFISKYSLNNHVKYLCKTSLNLNITRKCNTCKKVALDKCKCGERPKEPFKNSRKRKSYKPVKMENIYCT